MHQQDAGRGEANAGARRDICRKRGISRCRPAPVEEVDPDTAVHRDEVARGLDGRIDRCTGRHCASREIERFEPGAVAFEPAGTGQRAVRTLHVAVG